MSHTFSQGSGLVEGGYNRAKLETWIPLRRKVFQAPHGHKRIITNSKQREKRRRVSNILHQAAKKQQMYVKNIPIPTRIRAIRVKKERDQH